MDENSIQILNKKIDEFKQSKHYTIFINFLDFLKIRLWKIRSNSYICGKLVTNNNKTYRCFGNIEEYGCYFCNSTGIYCKGDCGNWVKEKDDFCSRSCYGEYFKDVFRQEDRYNRY